jgi:hypothetical protein
VILVYYLCNLSATSENPEGHCEGHPEGHCEGHPEGHERVKHFKIVFTNLSQVSIACGFTFIFYNRQRHSHLIYKHFDCAKKVF